MPDKLNQRYAPASFVSLCASSLLVLGHIAKPSQPRPHRPGRQMLVSFLLLLGCVAAVTLFFRPAISSARDYLSPSRVAAANGGQPLEQLLNPDGSLNLAPGFNGSFDASGWQMAYAANGAPRFKKAFTVGPVAPGDENWDPQFSNSRGVSGYVFAVAVSGSDVYVGGAIFNAGGVQVNNIARWDGSNWSALGNGVMTSGGGNAIVFAIAVNGNDVYVGGNLGFAGGSLANGIAKWDGSSWSALGSGVTLGSGANGNVSAIAVSGSNVYVGGTFLNAGGNPANSIAKWDGSSWSALGSGVNSSVSAIAISGGDVYVGGSFTTAGGNPVNRIAKWNGSSWSALGSGVNSSVSAIAVSGSDVYVGGSFTTAGGNPANRIAKWDGSNWSALGAGADNSVLAIAVSGSDVYVGGRFTTVGGNPANRIARWDGSNWSALGSGIQSNNDIFAYVNATAVSGNSVYVGGFFGTAGLNPSLFFARHTSSTVNRPPVAACKNVTVTADANCTAVADINNGSSDADGDMLTITQSPAGPYAVGTHTVTLTVDDGRGGTSTCTATVTVNAPKPVPSITGPTSGALYQVGTRINFAGTFTDLTGTTHTANWKFESATPPAMNAVGTVVAPAGATPGSSSVTQSFTTAGVYLVTLTVSNNCGGSGSAAAIGAEQVSALVVIYDPGAGFVTGGGWINSPAGAYVPNPALTGKANFGFVSKYQNGASVPTGNTEFQFKAGNLNFSSTVYEWMVVAGARAQYKGSGKINNAGDYRFMLTAIDGQVNGGGGIDKFRIRIWDNAGGGLVYDNQLNAPDSADPTTLLGGGSIVIHK